MKKDHKAVRFLLDNNTYIIFFALFLICCLISDKFFSYLNLRNILLQQAGPILVALGMLMVILTGGIDLSVGSVMAVGSSLTAVLMTSFGIPWILAILIALAAGTALGTFTGMMVAYLKFQGFVASLAVMTIARGIAYTITNATPINLENGTLNTLSSKESGYPIILIMLAVIVLFVMIEKYTAYGRLVIASGSNVEAVKLSGIRTQRYILSVYMISAALATLAGVFVAARSNVGNSTIGEGQELDAIAACVIGGASLAGGKGSVAKTVIGALILALIGNIMNLLAVPAYPQRIIKGCIIIAAVLLQVLTDKKED
ncbi:ribose import permease protein RbsC [Lachnospiraceae bacterium]|uniref:ABC transporter permease n=1 Tax=Candidatus Merdisoma sp. JLR.KK011 TaxID=3114299 RepID=UPI0014351BF7|nr:ABC transporter permease [Lachnospiraceae bacterium]GFI09766.1 ribose import permease protein RbsC [Lachnospiraceae bacterium]